MDSASEPTSIRVLTEREKAMLEFERSWWMSSTPKDVAVREQFQLLPEEYEVLLEQLIESDAALAHDELGVRRLRRRRDRRRRDHDARRTAEGDAR